jgi:hypothetical protein
LACHLQFDADPDPDYQFDADSDLAYHFYADPDPAYHFGADPHRILPFNLKQIHADPDPQHCSYVWLIILIFFVAPVSEIFT